jgi:hypothetical protein
LASKLKAAKLELSLADNAEERRPLKNKVAELEASLAIMTTASMASAPQPSSPAPSNRWRKAAADKEKALVEAAEGAIKVEKTERGDDLKAAAAVAEAAQAGAGPTGPPDAPAPDAAIPNATFPTACCANVSPPSSAVWPPPG